jgi:hypothetical protein
LDCRSLRGEDLGGLPFANRQSIRKAFFEVAAKYPLKKIADAAAETGATSGSSHSPHGRSFLQLEFGSVLPSEDDERALEFLCECKYNATRAIILLAAIAGGGHEVSALRHIEAARSHILGGKVRHSLYLQSAFLVAFHVLSYFGSLFVGISKLYLRALVARFLCCAG